MAELRWNVSVNSQALPGDHSTDEVRDLIRQHQGKTLLVWKQGMANWANPADLPEFKAAPAAPPPSRPAPAAPAAPAPSPGRPAVDKEELKKQAGVLKSLLDFRFENFIAVKIIPILYMVILAVIVLAAVGYFFVGGGGMIVAGIRSKAFLMIIGGLFIMILTPLLAVAYLALVRVSFEVIMVLFRIKDDLSAIVESKKKSS